MLFRVATAQTARYRYQNKIAFVDLDKGIQWYDLKPELFIIEDEVLLRFCWDERPSLQSRPDKSKLKIMETGYNIAVDKTQFLSFFFLFFIYFLFFKKISNQMLFQFVNKQQQQQQQKPFSWK